tara:strand:+ start:293 stop:1801 length:1509 start_codon:yes stop_codon:yes gene_type:complete
MAELFGFEIKRKNDKQTTENPSVKTFVPDTESDGAGVIKAGGHFGSYVDLDGNNAKNEADLILKYRDVASHPECDSAIEDIVNDAIIGDYDSSPVNVLLDKVDTSDAIKDTIREEFDNILSMLNFSQHGHDIFKKWYIDGRLPYHIVIDTKSPKKGILDLRYIDPIMLRKVKEVHEEQDPKTGAVLVKKSKEFFLYSDPSGQADATGQQEALKIHKDSIAYCTSGMLDPSRKRILSYLQKAVKPVNQLRMMEDSLVIYRISRAPERRIFYIDVGNLPKGKAEEYLKGIMNQYRNKLVYDASTGNIKDDKKHMSMLEDFFLPRREGGKGTEITTLPGGENLGQIDDILYFQTKLFKALNVPLGRLESDTGFSLGRASEINREEVKFKKFIDKLRMRFSDIFMQLLKTQLILKGIITSQDWDEWKEDINFDFIEDNYFSELKETEMIQQRFGMMRDIEDYIGKYVSHQWVLKNILRQTEEETLQMQKEIADEGGGPNAEEDEDE